MKFLALAGRVLFASVFLFSAPGHFSAQTIAFTAAHGVPAAGFLVPFSGVLELVGALSIILGYRAKWGAWLLVLFLVPVSIALHPFWKETDPMQHQMQMAMFLKNVSMTGAALFIAYFGAGPVSLDERRAAPREFAQA